MESSVIIIFSLIALFTAYKTYGTFVSHQVSLDDTVETPAHRLKDNIDYVPAKPPVLLGHHFASIAGAAPIIGPIVAAAYGWLPVVLWLLLGTIFIGAVHDFLSLIASARHDGQSIGQIVERHIGMTGKLLFLVFCWSALLLVIAVFIIVVAKTFATVPSSATSSVLFIVLAIFFGLTVYRMNASLAVATMVGVSILFTSLWLGIQFPLSLSINTWVFILIGYVFIASVTPVWILLQPRDYLNSFLLYAAIGCSVIGIVTNNPEIELPAFTGFHAEGLGSIFPVMFVTVACGAISGFHSLVASGTTSKQLDKESDSKLIGYGGMLLECLLGIIAIITAAVMTTGDYQLILKEKGPIAIFSQGVGQFMTALNIPLEAGI
ncbi:MAG: carbon starvation protein A, partial [Nitrospinota bacterium]